MEDIREVESISFGIMSEEEVIGNAVCEIKNSKKKGDFSVYDTRMGSLDSFQKCRTCGQFPDACTGHFGFIKLNEPVIHPLYFRRVENYLKCICYDCNRLILSKEQLQLEGILKHTNEKRFAEIIEKIRKTEQCFHCNSSQPKYKYSQTDSTISKILDTNTTISMVMTVQEIKKILENIPMDDIELLGFDTNLVQPKNLIITALPVLPHCDRPYVKADNKICDDDLTVQYLDIVKINNHLAEEGLTEQKRTKYITSLNFRILTTFNNRKGKAKHTTNNRPIKGIKERLTGKDGQIRGNCQGKRCDQTARTVIGADPNLKLGQIGIPEEMAQILTTPERATKFNINKLTNIVNTGGANYVLKTNPKGGQIRINLEHALYKKGTKLFKGDIIQRECGNAQKEIHVKTGKETLKQGDIVLRNGIELDGIKYPYTKPYNLSIGDVVERKLVNGDIVLLNRQPTLHKASMQAMEIQLHPNKTIKMNLAITSSFNADFDGDEMNIHVSQSYDAKAELIGLSAAKHNIISAQSSKPNMKIVQDSLLGAYRMTLKNEKITRSQFFDICMKLDMTTQEIHQRINHIRNILKQLGKHPEAFNGKGLFSMFLPEDLLYDKRNDADPKEPNVKIHRGVLYEGAIDKNIIGSAHNSLIQIINKEYGSDAVSKFIDHVQFVTNNWLMIDGFTVGLGDCILLNKENGDKRREIDEVIQKSFIEAENINSATSHLGIKEMRINAALNKAKDVGLRIAKEALDKNNHFLSTVISGSKGDFVNIAQITGLLGQQNLSGKRIPKVLNNGKRSLHHYPFKNLTPEQEYESRGFITSSFITGLTPREFYFHAMSGREGISDKLVSLTGGCLFKEGKQCYLLVFVIYY